MGIIYSCIWRKPHEHTLLSRTLCQGVQVAAYLLWVVLNVNSFNSVHNHISKSIYNR